MFRNLLGAFIGSKIEQGGGKPVTGAVVGAVAMAIAKRSLPLAIGVALGVGVLDHLAKRRAARLA